MTTRRQLISTDTELKRRQFLGTAVGASAGLAGILLTHTPPAYAAKRTVTMLSWNHFVTKSDETLRQMARAFGKENKCRVKIDFIPHRDTYVKVAKEQETRKGHDIVLMFFSKAHLHHEDLETLEFMDDLGKKLGGWYDLAYEAGQVQGRWVALPWFYVTMPVTYREDLLTQNGIEIPTTWEGWKAAGQKIKAASDFDGDVQKFTGHKTRSMAERYNRTADKVVSLDRKRQKKILHVGK